MSPCDLPPVPFTSDPAYHLSATPKSAMASRTPPNDSAPAYSDAEGGLVDAHAIRATPVAPPAFQSVPSYHSDEKKRDLSPPNPPNFYAQPKEKEKENESAKAVVSAAPARSPAKKKKVSRWVLWKLWFNTYRYVAQLSA